MATDNIEICNKALRSIGAAILSSGMVDITSTTPVTKEDKFCALFYADTRDKVLSRYDWNFARKRYHYESSDMEETVSGATQANPVVVTVTNHTYVVGDTVTFADVGGMTELNGNTYIISAVVALTTITLQDESGTALDGSAYTAYTSGGTVRRKPLNNYEYYFDLPSDFLIDRTEENNNQFEIEGGLLITDQEEINITYTAQITDTTKFPIHFEDVLVAALAEKMALGLSQSSHVINKAREDAATAYVNGVFIDAKQGLRKQNKKTSNKGTWASKRK